MSAKPAKGTKPVRIRLPRSFGALVAALSLLSIVAYLVLPPLGALVLGALTDSPPATKLRFTLSTLTRAWTDRQIWPALGNSFIFALSVSTIVLLGACLLAWLVERTDARVRSIVNVIIAAPVIMPAVLLINAWIMLLSPRSGMINIIAQYWFGLRRPPFDIFSFPGMIWVAVLQELPLAFLWLWPSFQTMDAELEEAALMNGASYLTVLSRVTLPVLKPSLLGAWVIFFIYAFGALAIPIMIGQPAGIFLFSNQIYLDATQFPTDMNAASAYSVFYVILSFAGIAAYKTLTKNADRYATIRGRSFRPRRLRLGSKRVLAEAVVFVILLSVAILPVMVLVWNSLLPVPQLPSLKSFSSFSFKNFVLAWNYEPARRALTNSLWLGASAGVLTTVVALAIGWCSLRLKSARRVMTLAEQLATAPVALPGLVIGTGLMWFYLETPIPVYGTPIILLIAYVTLHLPYALRICVSGIGRLHRELEESAATSGAPAPLVFARIVLPLVSPSVIASVLYVMLRSFREYAASVFLSGPGSEVVSVLVLDMSQSGNTNILSAYTVMISILMILAVVALDQLQRRFSISS